VAGRDLVTLFAGSYGSLGLITEATLRLEPLPQVSGGISLKCADPEHARRLVEEVSDPWIAASGIDLRWPSADEPLRLIVMIHGFVSANAARRRADPDGDGDGGGQRGRRRDRGIGRRGRPRCQDPGRVAGGGRGPVRRRAQG
jgi:FAD/FMN-containing dehydrogenase